MWRSRSASFGEALMDFITRDQARQDIVALGLPQIVLDAFDEKPLPYNLDVQFREPYTIFSLGPEGQAAYGQGRITPIWTGGGNSTIVAYHHAPERKGFFRFSIETREEEVPPVGMDWQQVLVQEFKVLWEHEWPDDRLKEVAAWFGFNHVDQLIAELPQANLDTFERNEVWYRSFREKVGGQTNG
jgi:hypothetical protein